jgi:hypothetical protein
VLGVAFAFWFAGRVPGLPAPAGGGVPGRWEAAWATATFAWLPAFVAQLHGYGRAARGFALLALVATAAATLLDLLTGRQVYPTTALTGLAFDGAVVLALLAFHPGAAPPRARPWLVALIPAVASVALLHLVNLPSGAVTVVLDPAGLYSVGVTLAGIAYLVAVAAAGRLRGGAAWPLALALLALGVLAWRLVTLTDYLFADNGGQWFEIGGYRAAPVTIGLVEVAAVLAVAVPLTGLAGRALRRLPRPSLDAG